jgi:hypothetical protein
MASYVLAAPAPVSTPAPGASTLAPPRRLRREASLGPRCPHCAGPLVFGEGCSVCPVCGYSGCSL